MKNLILSFIILLVLTPIVLSAQEEPFLIGRSQTPQTYYNSSSGLLLIPKVRVDGENIFINAYLTLKSDNTYELDSYGLKKLNEEEVSLANRIQSRPCGLADTLGRFSAHRSANNQEDFCLIKSFSTVEGDRIVIYLFIQDNSIQTIIEMIKMAAAGLLIVIYTTPLNLAIWIIMSLLKRIYWVILSLSVIIF